MWKSRFKIKLNMASAWWNLHAMIWHISYGGVAENRWTVGVVEQKLNPEPVFLTRPQWVIINIIDNKIRGQHIKSTQSITHENPQGKVVHILSILYSTWGLHLMAVIHKYYVLPD